MPRADIRGPVGAVISGAIGLGNLPVLHVAEINEHRREVLDALELVSDEPAVAHVINPSASGDASPRATRSPAAIRSRWRFSTNGGSGLL
jgi:hypothetical protein